MDCPLCQAPLPAPFLQLGQQPAHCNLLWEKRPQALAAPTGDIHLSFCSQCGAIVNTAFDPALMHYTQAYENSLHFSPHFQAYATELAQDLVARHALQGKDIVEIGSGKGDFLRLLCALGHNRGTGFDPSYVPTGDEPPNIRFVPAFYSPAHTNIPADFLLSRHVLEHIATPLAFMQMVRQAIGDRATAVFFEVPNALYTLTAGGIWDIIYEHVLYYTPTSLQGLFQRAGFAGLETAVLFGGQFLTIEATPSPPQPTSTPDGLTELASAVQAFAQSYQAKRSAWQAQLNALAGQKVVIWGTGSKGVTFLNALQTQEQIHFAVDINPRKQGKFVAGSGQEIVPPAFLKSYQPQAVILLNANYQTEIRAQLQDLGVTAVVLVA